MHGCRSRFLRWGAFILAASLLGPSVAGLAQDASPPSGETAASIGRDEFREQLRDYFGFEDPQARGGRVVIGEPAEIGTVNGLLANGYPTHFVTSFLFDKLVGISPIDGKPVPQLADSWEVGADGRTFTFRLNRSARWHDGADVTAEDVVFSFDVALGGELPTNRWSGLRGALASYRVVDADTVEMTATDRLATFLYEVPAFVPIVPRHVWEPVPPAAWQDDPGSTGEDPARVVGSGPFRFVAWQQFERVTLARNDAYYDAVPATDELVFRLLPNKDRAIEALRAGEVDAVEGVGPTAVEAETDAGTLRVDVFEVARMQYYAHNLDPARTPLFQDKRVRQALFVALDRPRIINTVLEASGELALGTQPRRSDAYAPKLVPETYAYDPERARALLAEAGWVDSNGDGTVDRDGREFRFEILANTEASGILKLLPELEQRWREIGVAVTPKLVGFQELQERIRRHDFDMFVGFQNWDSSGNQGMLFRCDAYPDGDNAMAYCNPEYDRLDDLQRREFDPERRLALLIQLSNLAWDDLPLGILRFLQSSAGYSTRLHNFRPDEFGRMRTFWSLQYVWVEP
ncbi:MAG: ABC transporter, substrate-binding protein (cluster 5, nickel/peptides/opines) [uncultured Thermomicrobiales bacterium]|uniref:ABC transporter, substrate-binding protein (Cluster 5, nickel/peptides/opines) n=1 Tax=uncultured Thermomicrobiales bacterium TaxID=1645740 RepID=A0A6J4UNB2_9BACT|nr:MAG: ABC transporter, substrate-binding protein (cluster 5, nickel/peptides/opines) [uncultured Thermomicrobiales bacterium]